MELVTKFREKNPITDFPNAIDGEMRFLHDVGTRGRLNADRKALLACNSSLQEAAMHLHGIPHNEDVKKLFAEINDLIVRTNELGSSIDDALAQ
jgi:hypothetical protein